MTSPLSNYLGNKVLQEYFGDSPVYLALHTADPGVTGSAGTELAGGGYARRLMKITPPSGKTCLNSEAIGFDDLPISTITHLALWDAPSAGHVLTSLELSDPISVPNSARLLVPAQEVALSL